jgi:hypothetical protein
MKLTQRNYFSKKANKIFMSVSQFKSFNRCPNSALAEIKGKYKREKSTALLVGSYVDSYFEGSLDKFKKENPEIFNSRTGELKSDYKKADKIIERIEKDKLFMEHLSGEKQVIMTGEICGVPIKIKIDSYHPGKQIDDLKIVRDFEPIHDDERGLLPWFEYWEYDLQGAIYQEIVRQNTGLRLPFYLDAATKEEVTDLDIIHVKQDALDFALERFKQDVESYDAMKKGILEPDRCEKCDYCKLTKVLKRPTESDEYYLI